MAKTDYTFETFMTIPFNRLARLAAEKVCAEPGTCYNPLVLFGAHGTGKTHLLHAMATSFLEKGLSVICVSAHQLVKDLVESIRSGDEKPFEETYQKADVVLIDDLHELAHKDTTQEFVWHLVENLISKEKQVVIALNDSYCENSTLRPSLREVLSRGLCVELDTPDLESRTFLVEQALINQGICWPKEACRYVALKSGASISQIEGEINKILVCKNMALKGYSTMTDKKDFVISLKHTLVKYKGKGRHIVIPDGVRKIKDSAFWNCKELVSVVIPDSVTEIGQYAFCGCENLRSVTLSNQLTRIPPAMFWRCESLVSVTIPDSIQAIGKFAFSNCKSLCSVVLPDSIHVIDEGAFVGCNNLDTITIPSQVTKLSGGVLFGCRSLRTLVLQDCVTEIAREALAECEKLEKIFVPASVTKIGKDAFRSCDKVVIHAPRGSYAETYVKEHNIKFSAE